MTEANPRDHWEAVYTIAKDETYVSWFQDSPVPSLEWIEQARPSKDAAIIDIGGGASRLVDGLLERGFRRVTVLDFSAAALDLAALRLGRRASEVQWILDDVTEWEPAQRFDIWHDHGAFHFLIDAADRAAYIARLKQALAPGGYAIIATFAADGPQTSNGLPVHRYDAAGLARELGEEFTLLDSRPHDHATLGNANQRFQFSMFRRRGGPAARRRSPKKIKTDCKEIFMPAPFLKTTRRAALGALAATGALAAAGSRSEAQAAPKTFVLVHGTWHGGWCWRRVADALERKGHKVYAPSLTGVADRSHLLTGNVNLTTHANDVANLVKWEDLKDIVLVGHSSAGFVITQAAEQIGPQVGSIVYLDAFVPQVGDSLISLANPGPRKALEEAVARGDLVAKPVPAAAFNVNEKDRAWVDAKCTPHPLAAVVEKVTAASAYEKIARKTYIRATGFKSPVFDETLAKMKAMPGWKTYEVASGHDVMVDKPDQLVDILLEVA